MSASRPDWLTLARFWSAERRKDESAAECAYRVANERDAARERAEALFLQVKDQKERADALEASLFSLGERFQHLTRAGTLSPQNWVTLAQRGVNVEGGLQNHPEIVQEHPDSKANEHSP